ncbi:MAG: PfkB family carbohydrate kinase [Actinomycetota bacterium]|nr:PfkB family carbohydrate kinase [Actinomycetota bacterium]
MGYVTGAQRFDVVSVGDVASDVFIRLADDALDERVDERGRFLEIPSGAKIPFERGPTVAAGGSAANAAVAMARLGLRVSLAAFLAHDDIGFSLLGALHAEGVDTRLVHLDDPAHTNRDFVLSYRGERTIFVSREEFDYHWPHLRPSEVPAWLYVTSLGRGARRYEDQIAEWLGENASVRLALQPGTFQLEAGAARLARLYERAELLVCSSGDATAICGAPASDPAAQLSGLLALGPSTVVVVDDSGGAVASDGSTRLRVPPFPDSSAPLDKTGATDAFAATLCAALVAATGLAKALRRASLNFMSVSHEVGSQAGLLAGPVVDEQLDEVGEDFHATTW